MAARASLNTMRDRKVDLHFAELNFTKQQTVSVSELSLLSHSLSLNTLFDLHTISLLRTRFRPQYITIRLDVTTETARRRHIPD
jgi:hypothetical protein